MKRLFVFAISLTLSSVSLGQNLHFLDTGMASNYAHSIYCTVPENHKTVDCTFSVQPLLTVYGPYILVQKAYLKRQNTWYELKLTKPLMSYDAAVSIAYGDILVMQWDRGQFAIQIGRGWTEGQWTNYLQRLTALSDWERSPEGVNFLREKMTREMGGVFPGGMGGPAVGSSRPCSLVQQDIQRTKGLIGDNRRGLDVMQGSIWSGSVQGMMNQNQQNLSALQSELSTCTP